MSTQQQLKAQIREIAKDIYTAFAASLGNKHWDWNPVAAAAMDAAESFNNVFNDRYAPQTMAQTGPVAAPADAPAEPAQAAPA